ncbi:hypothetical protein EGW08_020445 [Elysia chlorotica]|uniref:Uncharacterized protein n=1 Tax=Elysia chlorotica TaxID=188477 RepID=A0A3S1BPM3_ELYCH|nr:hypothetical protein EGW08_020445 [Elysia chlorotica]
MNLSLLLWKLPGAKELVSLVILTTSLCDGGSTFRGENTNAPFVLDIPEIGSDETGSGQNQIYDANLIDGDSVEDATRCTCEKHNRLWDATTSSIRGLYDQQAQYNSDNFEKSMPEMLAQFEDASRGRLNGWDNLFKKHKKEHAMDKMDKSSAHKRMKSPYHGVKGRRKFWSSGIGWWKPDLSSKHQNRPSPMTMRPYTLVPDTNGKTRREDNQASQKQYTIFPQAIAG